MCGIAGILAGKTGPIDEHALRAVTSALSHRGPDGEGYHIEAAAGLGHRRLAIIDVAGGKQPLTSEDRRVVGIVNGEIYNFQSLRTELESRGHTFATRSDSEVLVHGYEEWGDDVLDRLEGMFALAVWDSREKRLLLARDRMGEKPLYWAPLPGGGFAFASELKALKRCPGLDDGVSPAALARFLVYEYLPAPYSILRGAHKLPPGHKLVVEKGAPPRVQRYWDLPFPGGRGVPPVRETDLHHAADVLLMEMRRSVRERLVSDVPLGVFLSGGIDSSTVAVLASEVRGSDLETFCIGFDDPDFDESGEARKVARAIGSRHFEERLSPSVLLDLLPAIGTLLDEPLGDSSIVPTHLLSRFARKHVTVALGGDGGDELFSGYQTFLAEQVARVVFDGAPGFVGRTAAALGEALAARLPTKFGYMPLDFKLKRFLRGVDLTGARRHQAWMGAFSPDVARTILAPDLARVAGEDYYDVIDERLADCSSQDPWDRLMYFYAKGFLADEVLTKVDRASMAVGLEVRAPLLDRGVIGLACRLAPSLRLRRLETKVVLKKAMRGLLPDEILDRNKHGFSMPLAKWLRGQLRPLLEEELSESRLLQDGFFDAAAVRKIMDEHVEGKADHRKALWTLLAFQLWLRSWRAL